MSPIHGTCGTVAEVGLATESCKGVSLIPQGLACWGLCGSPLPLGPGGREGGQTEPKSGRLATVPPVLSALCPDGS